MSSTDDDTPTWTINDNDKLIFTKENKIYKGETQICVR